MKTQKFGSLVIACGALASVFAMASPAAAQPIACTYLSPGMLAAVRPAGPCVYQGDRIAQRGPVYDGPAVIAPQSTYAPSRTAAGYPYVPGVYHSAAVMQMEPMRGMRGGKRGVVNLQSDLPHGKGTPQIVRARAEVHIYGPERMDIRLYRH